jgi:drug/metabolite transporter (DMT)-like permease
MTIRTTWRSMNSQGPTVSRRYSAAVTTPTTAPEEAPFAPLDWALLLGAASIWGGSFLLMAIGLDAFEPGLVTFLPIAFGATTLLLVPAARASIPRADMGRVAILGLTWMAFPLTMFPIAQQWIDSSVAGMLNAAMPLLTVSIAWLGFRTPTASRSLVGVGVGIVGILLIGIPEATTAGTNAAGVGLVVLAVGSYGIAVNIAGPLQRRYGALPVTARALSFATILTVPYGAYGLADSTFAWDSLLACVAAGALGTGVAFAFAATLTGRVGAVRTSIITYVVPLVSIVLGVVFRNETVSVLAIIGTGVVLCGAWLSSRTA